MQIGKLTIVNNPREVVIMDLLDVALGPRLGRSYACFCEAHLFVRAHKEPHVLSALKDAAFVFPDGTSLALGARMAGQRIHERHPGPTVLLDLCENGQAKGLKHYFYGGRDGVGDRLSAKLQTLFPKIKIVGHESPPFRELTELEKAEVIERIEASGADVLWVGLGAPKQELWMQAHLGKIKVPLMMGVGAAFEYFSGDQKWAPYWMRRYGLEWFYRMMTGGPRLFKRYLTYVPLSMYWLMKESLRSRLQKQRQVGARDDSF